MKFDVKHHGYEIKLHPPITEFYEPREFDIDWL